MKTLRIAAWSLVLLALGGSPIAKAGEYDNVPVFELPSMGEVFAHNAGDDDESRYAYPTTVNINPAEHGVWEQGVINNRWRLRLRSEGAYSLDLGFTRYMLPLGAYIIIRDPDDEWTRGPYDSRYNRAGQLWTAMIPGEELVIELSTPKLFDAYSDLKLGVVNIGYRSLVDANHDKGLGDSGFCNVDTACSEADAWQDEVKSVAIYTSAGKACTGTLINNTREDGRPLFYTGAHCVSDQSEASQMVVYWDFENSRCGGQDATLRLSQSGAELLAVYEPSDSALVELSRAPTTLTPRWAGFNASGELPDKVVAIHHPRADAKKFSADFDPLTVTFYRSDTAVSTATHWRIADWDVGTTEAGSSGSALFDQNHRVIGSLHGGRAACGNDDPDWFGRLSVGWEGDDTCRDALKYWLDPDTTGQQTIDIRSARGAADEFPGCSKLEDDKYENNDSPQNSYFLPEGKVLRDIAGDGVQLNDDWYRIDVAESNSRVVVDLTLSHSKGDLRLSLHDAFGSTIAESDSQSDHERIDVSNVSSGNYYVYVGGFKSFGESQSTGNRYNLSWTSVKSTSSAPEPPAEPEPQPEQGAEPSSNTRNVGPDGGGGGAYSFWVLALLCLMAAVVSPLRADTQLRN